MAEIASTDEKIKKRKIRKEDWDEVQTFVKKELDNRRTSEFRKSHEKIWKEVDRQIKMQPMVRLNEVGQKMPPSWNSAFELGELSKASEIICADVMRIMFPEDWFLAHVDLEKTIGPDGQPISDPDRQELVDGLLRSLMVQQQEDFGFKERFEMSVKEALHHGSFVAEVLWDSEMQIMDGDKVKTMTAPTWIPHSMWNCYPDPSPRIIGTNLFYTGSMLIVSYMPMYKLKRMSGDGWMQSKFDEVPKTPPTRSTDGNTETKKAEKDDDVELATYYGDVVITRADGDDIYLPNSKVVVANGVIVYYKSNDLPYPSVIHGGYEKQDVRDPYFMSPIIKQSPIQKLTTIIANKFVDAISLKVEPPGWYNANDPQLIANGGPTIAPGVMTGTRGTSDIKFLDVGDPTWALQGMEMGLRQLQEGTGVSAIRSAVPSADRQTATEVNKTEQAAEVRTVDFIAKLNAKVNSFLYMQHHLNVKYLKEYTFYNNNVNSPDFIRVTKKQMDFVKTAHFDVVGARGVLGEDRRHDRTAAVTAFLSGNPLFIPLLKPDVIALDAYKNAGNKNPEKFINPPDQAKQIQQAAQQLAQQQVQPLQLELQQTKEALAHAQLGEQSKMAIAQTNAEATKAELAMKAHNIDLSHQSDMAKVAATHQAKLMEIAASHEAQLKSLEDKFNREISVANQKLEHAHESMHLDGIAKIADSITKLQPPNIVIHPPNGSKVITLPDGRKAKIEPAPPEQS